MRKSMLCGLLVLGLAVTMAAAPAVAGTRGGAALESSLSIEKGALATSDVMNFRFTLSNPGAEDLFVLKWKTPISGFEADTFIVERDGERLAYNGKLVKRAAPRASDYVRVPAGGSLSVDVDLSSVYDMTQPGNYTVRYMAEGVDVVRADHAKRQTASSFVTLESGLVALQLTGPALDARTDSVDDFFAGTTKALTPTYRNCSSSRISQIGSALSNAQTYATNAYNYLAARTTSADRTASTRYRTWFGAYNATRYTNVQAHYNSIKNALANQTFILNCDCASDTSTYAFVYANLPYEVHLCGAFFAAPATGTDSKAGTIVHETSHFTVVAGTNDYAYGQSACKSLATSNPSRATNNADSHEYFSENTPSLP